MNKRPTKRNPLLSAAAALFMVACETDKPVGPAPDPTPSDSLSRSVLDGVLRLPGGGPAAGAEIRIYPVDFVPGPAALSKEAAAGDPAYVVHADSEGRYQVDSLERGEYNVIAQSGDLVSFRDSVFLAAGTTRDVADTLGAAGGMAARIELQPIHDPRKATVHVLGTNAYANVDMDGLFSLPRLAAGDYSLVVDVRESDYTPLYRSVRIRAGTMDTLPDPLRVPYTGIPVVQGLKVTLDTLAGIAHLHWNPVEYRSFKSYVVLRMRQDALDAYFLPIGVTRDTAWEDTIYPTASEYGTSGLFPDSESDIEYQIAVRSQTLEQDPVYGSAALAAAPPSRVQTAITIESRGDDQGDASLNDTVRVIAFFRNPTRRLARLEWREAKSDSLMRTVRLGAGTNSGFDTLTVVGNALRTYYLSCDVTDDAGRSARQRYDIHFISSPPRAFAGRDTLAAIGDTLLLRGVYSNRFGPAKLEWDIGATGSFSETPDGTVRFPVPAPARQDVPCILKATNSDGEIGRDTLTLRTSIGWRKVGEAPFEGNFGQLVVFQDRLWLIGGKDGSGAGGVYSTTDGATWRAEPVPDSIGKRTHQMAFVFRDSLWIACGLIDGFGENGDIWNSADGREWHLASVHSSATFRDARAAVQDGKLYIALTRGGMLRVVNSSNGRDFATDTPSVASPSQMFGLGKVNGFSSLGGNLYLTVVSNGGLEGWTWSQGNAWRKFPLPLNMYGDFVSHDGRLWICGSGRDATFPVTLEVQTSSDGVSWEREARLPRLTQYGAVTATYAGSIWLIDNKEVFRTVE